MPLTPRPASAFERRFLFLVCAASLLWLMFCGLTWNLGYDESWHIFFAAHPLSEGHLREIAGDTHPPLPYFLMRPLVAIGSEPIWPRLLSILPACVQPWLFGAILRKLGVGRVVRLAIVLVFALSYTFAVVGVIVRSYSLATMCFLAALSAALDLLPDSERARRRSVVSALGFSTLGVVSLYAAGFSTALVAFGFAASALLAGSLRLWIQPWRTHGRAPEWLLFLGGHLGCFGWFLLTYGDKLLPHVQDYYPRPDQRLLDFFWQGTRQVLEALTPLPTNSPGPAWVVLGMGCSVWALLLFRTRGRDSLSIARRGLLIALPAYFGLLFLLAVLRKYPYGGEPRHMVVLYPLLLIFVAFALDELTRQRPRPALILGSAMVAVAIPTSWHGHARRTFKEIPFEPHFSQDLPDLFSERHEDLPIYVTLYPFQGFYAGQRASGWQMRERVDDLDVLTLGRRWTVYRDRTIWMVPETGSAEVAERLESVLRHSGSQELVVYAPQQFGRDHELAHDEIIQGWAEFGFEAVEVDIRPDTSILKLRRR